MGFLKIEFKHYKPLFIVVDDHLTVPLQVDTQGRPLIPAKGDTVVIDQKLYTVTQIRWNYDTGEVLVISERLDT